MENFLGKQPDEILEEESGLESDPDSIDDDIFRDVEAFSSDPEDEPLYFLTTSGEEDATE